MADTNNVDGVQGPAEAPAAPSLPENPVTIKNPLPLAALLSGNPQPIRVRIVSEHELPEFGEDRDHWAVLVSTEDKFYAGTIVLAEEDVVPQAGELWDLFTEGEGVEHFPVGRQAE